MVELFEFHNFFFGVTKYEYKERCGLAQSWQRQTKLATGWICKN